MIVRVLRASIATGRSADFHAFVVDVGVPSLLGRDGLLDVHVGLRSEGSQEIGIIVSVWRDWAALEAAVGPEPERPYLMDEMGGLIVEATVEHFEALAVPLLDQANADLMAEAAVAPETELTLAQAAPRVVGQLS